MATTVKNVNTKPASDSTYELLSIVERLAFWSMFFGVGYLATNIFLNNALGLLSDFFRTV